MQCSTDSPDRHYVTNYLICLSIQVSKYFITALLKFERKPASVNSPNTSTEYVINIRRCKERNLQE